MSESLFDCQERLLEQARLMRVTGRVVEWTGLTVVAEGLALPVGATCVIRARDGRESYAQVVGFRSNQTLLVPMSDAVGTAPGDPVISSPSMESIGVSHQLLGRVLNGMGRPIDSKGAIRAEDHYPIYGDAPLALNRRPIDRPLVTGIRAIDAMHTVGAGQRMGLFAGTGVGKSVLLGMIARYTAADVTVIALVGERGREVGDFLRKDLDQESLRKTVMVVSTSDESPVLRVRACFVATAVAEYFRDQGKDVLLLMDSTTRMAMAQRQIGLAAGEPPTTKGYPPSVFALLPRLLERAGRTERGSITGIYTVLVEGDDINEPISDAVRGILDGHLWLSRSLANSGHYPAVSVLDSISRVMVDIVDAEHLAATQAVRRVLAVWNDIEDLVNIGAYAKGTNLEFDLAVEMKPQVAAFFQQKIDERAGATRTRQQLLALHGQIRQTQERLRGSGYKPAAATPLAEPAAGTAAQTAAVG